MTPRRAAVAPETMDAAAVGPSLWPVSRHAASGNILTRANASGNRDLREGTPHNSLLHAPRFPIEVLTSGCPLGPRGGEQFDAAGESASDRAPKQASSVPNNDYTAPLCKRASPE
ncbi:hypothetical protein MRX96_059560 [Rhipicephalus microplus]